MSLTLVIGNKNYSSWSMRAWMFLRLSGVEFEEVRIPMMVDGWRDRVRRFGPAGRLPVLVDGDFAVWDTLAIIAYVRERYEGALGWPADPRARARARSVSAEMHAGFPGVRNELPLNVRRRTRLALDGEAHGELRGEVDRITEIWRAARAEFGAGGPWLFGELSIADVMYAPVASRFATYGVELGEVERDWVEEVLGLDVVREWAHAAAVEEERIECFDRVSTASAVEP